MRNTAVILVLAALQLSSAYGDAFLPFYWDKSISQELGVQFSGPTTDYYSPQWLCSESEDRQAACQSAGTTTGAYGAIAMRCASFGNGSCLNWVQDGSFLSGKTATKWSCDEWANHSCILWRSSNIVFDSYCYNWDCTRLDSATRSCAEWSGSQCTLYCWGGDSWQCTQWQSGRCTKWQGSGCHILFRTYTQFTIIGKPSPAFAQNASMPRQQDAKVAAGETARFAIAANGLGNGTCAIPLPPEADNQSVRAANASGGIPFALNGTTVTFNCDLDASDYGIGFNATAPNATVEWRQDGTATPWQQRAIATIAFQKTGLKFENVTWAIECLGRFACQRTNGTLAVLQNATSVQVAASSSTAIAFNASSWSQPGRVEPNQTALLQRQLWLRNDAAIALQTDLTALLQAGWNCTPTGMTLESGREYSPAAECTFQNAISVEYEGNWTSVGGGVFEKTFSGMNNATAALDAIITPTGLPTGNSSPLSLEPAQFAAPAGSNWSATARAVEATPTPSPTPTPPPQSPGGGGSGGGGGGFFEPIETATPVPTPTSSSKANEIPTPAQTTTPPCATAIVAPPVVEPGVVQLRFFECGKPADGTAVLVGPGGTRQRGVANGSLDFIFEREGKWIVSFKTASRQIEVVAASPAPLAMPKRKASLATGLAVAGRPDYSTYLFLASAVLAAIYFSGAGKARLALEKKTEGNKVTIRVRTAGPLACVEIIDLVPEGFVPTAFSPPPQEVEETVLGTKVKWVMEKVSAPIEFSYELDGVPPSLPIAQLKAVDERNRKVSVKSANLRREAGG